jgi:dihydroxyacetone kinase-like protein
LVDVRKAMITNRQILQWLRATAAMLEENKQYLTDLDSPIGDADHGINMDRGFKKVLSQLPAVEGKDIGTILRATGIALMSSVGGAGGPLYGTFFIDAGQAVTGKVELSQEDLALLLESGLKGVVRIGRASMGDKTMVDALHPAVEALKEAVASGVDAAEALRRMVQAAREGMEKTIPMVARKGRASYVGERAIGHQDPGATSSFLVLRALLKTVESGTCLS